MRSYKGVDSVKNLVREKKKGEEREKKKENGNGKEREIDIGLHVTAIEEVMLKK